MPDLPASAVVIVTRALGVQPVKVKKTDDADVGLALFVGGFGLWVNLKTGAVVKPGTIGGAKVTNVTRATVKNVPGLILPKKR